MTTTWGAVLKSHSLRKIEKHWLTVSVLHDMLCIQYILPILSSISNKFYHLLLIRINLRCPPTCQHKLWPSGSISLPSIVVNEMDTITLMFHTLHMPVFVLQWQRLSLFTHAAWASKLTITRIGSSSLNKFPNTLLLFSLWGLALVGELGTSSWDPGLSGYGHRFNSGREQSHENFWLGR